MNANYQFIGDTVCEWQTLSPLVWTMSETTGKGDGRRTDVREFDLTPLTSSYDEPCLLELRDLLMARRKRVALVTLFTEYLNVRRLMRDVQDCDLLTPPIRSINEAFLLALRTIPEKTNHVALDALKRLFLANRTSRVFDPSLLPEDFPRQSSEKGRLGEFTSRILTKALSRAACVEVLRIAEDAYESGKIDIGHFSFLHLAFHVFCRPQSYRRLTLSDLQIDTDPDTGVRSYFLMVVPAKTRVHEPKKIAYRLNRIVGELLETQRAHVIDTYGHLIDATEAGKLALFPSRRLLRDGTWMSAHSRSHHGEATTACLSIGYLRPIAALNDSVKLSFNALRHTIGTQLAQAGCSALTIQAVLKHSGYKSCQAYVDIAFHGLVGKLSDALQPAFEQHFRVFEAFRSKSSPIAPQRAIKSEDLRSGHLELTGECGQLIACQYAPLTCYACPQFVPCHDADHSINLDAIDQEIELCESRGLPFRHLLEKAKDARRHIILVMAAVDQRRNALAPGSNNDWR